MADSFPILFTGRELDFDVPKFTEMSRAADNLQKKLQIEQAEQADLRREFRKNLGVDMETFVSNYATQQQADIAKAFTDKYTLEVKKNGGKITNDILMNMQKDANAMASRQKQWLQSQELWKRDKSLIEQQGGQALYDIDKFGRDTEEFMRTGIYKPNSLEYLGVNMTALFNATKWQGKSPVVKDNVKTSGSYDIITTTTTPTDNPKEAQQYIVSTILSNPRNLKGAQKDFEALDDKTKSFYLEGYDANGDGIIQPEEKTGNINMSSMNILENPIMRWAISNDGYLPVVMQSSASEPKIYKRDAARTVSSEDGDTFTYVDEGEGYKTTTVIKGAANIKKWEEEHPELVSKMKAEADTRARVAEEEKARRERTVPAGDSKVGAYERPIPALSDKSYTFQLSGPLAIEVKDDQGKIDKYIRQGGVIDIVKIRPVSRQIVISNNKGEKIIPFDDLSDDLLEKILDFQVQTAGGNKRIADITTSDDVTMPKKLEVDTTSARDKMITIAGK